MNMKVFVTITLIFFVVSCGDNSRGGGDAEQITAAAQSDSSSTSSASISSSIATNSEATINTTSSSSSSHSSRNSIESSESNTSTPISNDILKVILKSPESSTLVLPTSKIIVLFNQDLMINSINHNEAVELEVYDSGEPIEGDIQVDGARKIIFTPTKPLSQNVKYKANVSSGIIAANGATYLGEEWSFQTLTEALSQLGTTTQAEIDECGSRRSVELLSKFIEERDQPTDNRCGAYGFGSVENDMLGLNCELNRIAKLAVDNSFNQYSASANATMLRPAFARNKVYEKSSDNYASYSARASTERIQYDDAICGIVMNSSFTEFGGEYIVAPEILEDGSQSGNEVYFLEMSFR